MTTCTFQLFSFLDRLSITLRILKMFQHLGIWHNSADMTYDMLYRLFRSLYGFIKQNTKFLNVTIIIMPHYSVREDKHYKVAFTFINYVYRMMNRHVSRIKPTSKCCSNDSLSCIKTKIVMKCFLASPECDTCSSNIYNTT